MFFFVFSFYPNSTFLVCRFSEDYQFYLASGLFFKQNCPNGKVVIKDRLKLCFCKKLVFSVINFLWVKCVIIMIIYILQNLRNTFSIIVNFLIFINKPL